VRAAKLVARDAKLATLLHGDFDLLSNGRSAGARLGQRRVAEVPSSNAIEAVDNVRRRRRGGGDGGGGSSS
jgi:hypothetical protein